MRFAHAVGHTWRSEDNDQELKSTYLPLWVPGTELSSPASCSEHVYLLSGFAASSPLFISFLF